MFIRQILIMGFIAQLFTSCVFTKPFDSHASVEQRQGEALRPAPTVTISQDKIDSIARRLGPPLRHLEIASAFGQRGKKFHEGVDMKGRRGDPVYAAHAAKVGISGERLSGYGEMIVLKTEDFITVYGHLDEILVREGQQVQQGEIIGRVGATGDASGPHLHFELRLKPSNGNYYQSVDPEPFLRRIAFE